jgi:hypothetical protein
MDKRGWNIHETVYATNITSKRLYYIVKKEPVVYYNIQHTDHSLIPVIPGSESKLNIESIWNELLCGCGGVHGGVHGGVSGGGISKSPSYNTPRIEIIDRSEEVLQSIASLSLAEDEIAVYRILYNTSESYNHGACYMRMFTTEDDFKTYVDKEYVQEAEIGDEENYDKTIIKEDPKTFRWNETESLPSWRPLYSDPLICWIYWFYAYGNYTIDSQGGWGVKQIIHIDKNGVSNKY